MKKKIVGLVLSVVIAFSMISMLGVSASAANYDSKAGIVNTSSSSLNVRSDASSTAPMVTTLAKGSYVTLISKTGTWYYVEYASGKYGYCSASYISEVTGSYAAYVNATSLNVRSGAGTTYNIISTLQRDTNVVVISTANGWSKIVFNGTQTGYVSSTYLGIYYMSISLAVPNYKQTDSRWSNTLVGDSGKTISQIGCATTCLAMTESYRTGTTIYPNKMESMLTYMPGGALYWPSNYVISRDSDYLNIIYTQLSMGKPVILAGAKSTGSTHFVVVTGFAGGKTLSASGFTINDPGSSTRTTLQDLFSVYPTFYELVYDK